MARCNLCGFRVRGDYHNAGRHHKAAENGDKERPRRGGKESRKLQQRIAAYSQIRGDGIEHRPTGYRCPGSMKKT